MQTKFPDFVIGFDLVGQEDRGRPLIDFADQILTLPPTIKFFFHAGETNWSGQTDDNLVSNDTVRSLQEWAAFFGSHRKDSPPDTRDDAGHFISLLLLIYFRILGAFKFPSIWSATKIDNFLVVPGDHPSSSLVQVDAILLGTQRIGHGYALIKHPSAMEFIKRQGIAVEVNPISNQVLRLVADTRNHPAAVLFSDNYPVVISSDDPSFWEAKPLSHDFFVAFLGIANSRQDMRFLKQLAINSIKYSAMPDAEKNEAMDKWQAAWDRFVDVTVAKLGNSV